jgi:acyl-CoA thioesterase
MHVSTDVKQRSMFTDTHRHDRQRIEMGYLEEIRNHGRDANPFLRLMEINIDGFGDGEAELSMQVRQDMLNGAGWLQGGLFTALCDEAMALALFTVLEERKCIATISESTSFLQGIRKGKVIAKGRVVKMGRQVAFTESMITDDERHQLSQTFASFAIINPR